MRYHLDAVEMAEFGVEPARAGWTYTGMKIIVLAAGETRQLTLPGEEAALIPLAGEFTVTAGDGVFQLRGRPDVFSGPTDLVYLPPGSKGSLTAADGAELALCTARAGTGPAPFYRPAEEVLVEVRGAGAGTRQINQLLPADVPGPERLIVVEVITPDGNWSSYPPHKHDELGERECPLEEIYYFRFDSPQGFGLHRTYTKDGSIDETATVRHGDAFLVPRGYHGPCGALPGYPMYYLNAMAGPGPRAWLISTDPDHAWLWDRWADEAPDRRMTAGGFLRTAMGSVASQSEGRENPR